MHLNGFRLLVVLSLLIIALNFQQAYLADVWSCDTALNTSQLVGKVLQTTLVYNALQCQDFCFRLNSCNGFNLNLNKTAIKKMACELLQLDYTFGYRPSPGWVHKIVNETETRRHWVGEECI